MTWIRLAERLAQDEKEAEAKRAESTKPVTKKSGTKRR